MPITITFQDDGNGTTATATVAGSVGQPVQVLWSPADKPWPADPWGVAGTRVGDGTVTVTLPPRLYFGAAKSPIDCTTPMPFAIINPADAVATRCRNAVVARIKLLGLNRIGEKVYSHLYPDDSGVETYPCVVCSSQGLSERMNAAGLNMLDEKGYPVKVGFYETGRNSDHTVLPELESWREKVARAVMYWQPDSVPESLMTTVEPMVIVEPGSKEYGLLMGYFVVRVTCREPRGLGA
jgi:hypothetical protein